MYGGDAGDAGPKDEGGPRRNTYVDWRALAEQWAQALTPERRQELAVALGLPEAALRRGAYISLKR